MIESYQLEKPGRPRFNVGQLLRQYGALFLATAILCPTVRRVLQRLMVCRTEELGGHKEVCDGCGYEGPIYNSCGNRHCPTCQGAAAARWVKERLASWLPTDSFHTVFTLPAQVRPLIFANRKALFNLMFRSMSEALLELTRDPKWGGFLPAITVVLHTWARDLSWHPHLHVIVSAGGLSLDEQSWVKTKGKFLLPVRVMSRLFRGKFLDGLKKLYEAGELEFRGGLEELSNPKAFEKLLSKLYRMEWVVWAKPPFASPEHTYRYLGHYTHRMGLSNKRLQEVKDGELRFQTRGSRSVTLKLEEFFRRLTLHILPSGFVRIRHYGLMSQTHKKTKLEIARKLLEGSKSKEENQEGKHAAAKTEEARVHRCPTCGGTLRRGGDIKPTRCRSHTPIRPRRGALSSAEARAAWQALAKSLGLVNQSESEAGAVPP